jgi:hypothetical protein
VISGANLQDALDPLGDQGYSFSAVRCENEVTGGRSTYGVAPRKSRLWFKRSKSWQDYADTVLTLLQALDESTTVEDMPLPVLSMPVQGLSDPQQLGAAYEMSLLPLELTNPGTEDTDHLDDADVPEFAFDVLDGAVPILRVRVSSDSGETLGEYRFQLHLSDSGAASWVIEALPDADAPTLALLRSFSRRLNVSFDGGFAISDGVVHSARHRDLPFGGFRWETFDGATISKEKPDPLTPHEIGLQDSLFCWIKRKWGEGTLGWLPPGGWLACNDGALEVADFVHLHQSATPTLTLIHVKGSTNGSPQRGLAVAPYEVVVSQAVKNARHLDSQLMAAEFTQRLATQVQAAVWRDAGVPGARLEMLAAIHACGANLARRVVIVQPQTRRLAHSNGLTATEGSKERHLVRQLNGLLLGAQQTCGSLGAEFVVIGEDA